MNLKRRLLLHITLCALAILLVATAWILQQARTRVGTQIERTGSTIQQLISDQIMNRTSSFERTIETVDLAPLEAIGELIHFCAEVTDIHARPVAQRCFASASEPPAVIRSVIARLIGPEVHYRGIVGQYPGIKTGELLITPNLDSEAADAWAQIRTVLWIVVGVLGINLLVYLPVRRALQPTDSILRALGRMEAGDLSVRLPPVELIELNRISQVINHLAENVQATRQAQQQLAQRLLTVREEERRHLARELHDELGQCLTSIRAEAAYATELAQEELPALLPCASAIGRIAGDMMESLQQILHRLRPVGLEEFGLAASLESLVDGWRQRSRGRCTYKLRIDGAADALPDEVSVNLYRIVQEALTNATRHGQPEAIDVTLRCGDQIELTVNDDGNGPDAPDPEPGFGLLGMRERVQALGGRFAITPRQPRGMQVSVSIPAPAQALSLGNTRADETRQSP